MNLDLLKVYESPFPKRRVGKPYDGGYIVCEIPGLEYSLLLSGGISNDISFEVQFLDRYEDCSGYAYDGTINALPYDAESLAFVRKNIGPVETSEETNLHDRIEGARGPIFLKMDIEGAELAWIQSLSREHIDAFEQIVIEFHDNFWRGGEGYRCLAKFLESHRILHFHPNNSSDLIPIEGVQVPQVFELTLVHKKHLEGKGPLQLNTEAIPTRYDQPNVLYKPDMQIDYPPFVWPSREGGCGGA